MRVIVFVASVLLLAQNEVVSGYGKKGMALRGEKGYGKKGAHGYNYHAPKKSPSITWKYFKPHMPTHGYPMTQKYGSTGKKGGKYSYGGEKTGKKKTHGKKIGKKHGKKFFQHHGFPFKKLPPRPKKKSNSPTTPSPTSEVMPPPEPLPTPNPTLMPTPIPGEPTPMPTPAPTQSPTPAPTPSPTPAPTPSPTPTPGEPTAAPTSASPTAAETPMPTDSTGPGTQPPSTVPSLTPTMTSSPAPTENPAAGTLPPTAMPSPMPTGSTETPTVSPSTVPTGTPTATPTETPTCFTDFATINILEDEADVSQVREYEICPNSVIETLDDDFLFLRANLTVTCGPDGASSNNCVVTNGFFGFGTARQPEFLDNVFISGFTFEDLEEIVVFIYDPGTVTIFDCIFQNNTLFHIADVNWAPNVTDADEKFRNSIFPRPESYLTDFQDSESKNAVGRLLREPTADDFLDITFDSCTFLGNIGVNSSGAFLPTMIVAAAQTRLTIDACLFQENDFTPVSTSTALMILGVSVEDLQINDCCFIDNGVLGPTPNMVLFSAAGTASGNFRDTQDPPQRCELLAIYETLGDDGINGPFTECFEADSETCTLGL